MYVNEYASGASIPNWSDVQTWYKKYIDSSGIELYEKLPDSGVNPKIDLLNIGAFYVLANEVFSMGGDSDHVLIYSPESWAESFFRLLWWSEFVH